MKEKLIGKFISNERGFGFVEIEDRDEDIFIPPHMTGDAMNGDIVGVKIVNRPSEGHRAEGKVTEIIKRSTTTVIGTFQRSKNFGFVVPDDNNLGTDIFIPKSSRRKAKNDDKVIERKLTSLKDNQLSLF